MRIFWLISLSTLISVAVAHSAFGPEHKNDIEKIISNYLNEHPEVIAEAIQHTQEKEHQNRLAKAEDYLNKNTQELLRQIVPYKSGPGNAKISVIEFLDYRCGHCKGMYQELTQLKSLIPTQVAYLQLPILGPQSTKAATLALSATSPSQFSAINSALFSADGILDDDLLSKLAKQHKITMRPETELQEKLKTNYTWAMQLGIQGAPAIVITNGTQSKIFFGKISNEILHETIKTLHAHTEPSAKNVTSDPLSLPQAA